MTAVTATPVAADTNLVIGGQGTVSYTNGDGVNVRDAVGYDTSVLFALPEGEQINIIGGPNTDADGNVWYNVDVDGTLGWIVSDYLARPAISTGQFVAVVGTNGDGLRLREGASLDAATVSVIPEGTTVEVVGGEETDSGGNVWAKVSYDGATGYSSRDFLALSEADAAAEAAPAEQATPGLAVGGNAAVVKTDGDGLNLRYDATYGAGVASVAAEGDVVHIIDGPKTDAEGVTWWGVDYKGIKGWMHGGFLTPTDQQPTQAADPASTNEDAGNGGAVASNVGQQIASVAMEYLGYPYVWGGTTPAGFDCSGFVYHVVNEVTGGDFPRSLEAQATSGTYVDPNDLRPGDLVFQQNTYKWGLSHVGIYIGNGQFINAANEGTGVVISNLWDSYWGSRYYTARRVQ